MAVYGLCVFVVRAFGIYFDKSVERDDLAAGSEALCRRSVFIGQFNGRILQFRIRHLRGDGALVDQIIETLLSVVGTGDGLREIGRADGFVCFLRAFALGAEFADLVVFRTEMCFNVLGDSGDGIVAQVKAVRSHVSDVSGFV